MTSRIDLENGPPKPVGDLNLNASPKPSETNSTQRLAEDVAHLTEEIQALYQLDSIPWVIGYSGGKDSTAILQLIWWSLARLPVEKRTKTVYVISTDTRVESPVVSAWVNRSLHNMRVAAAQQEMPFEAHLLYPETKDTFWVNLIGKGYPAPRHMFRWCTDRLKIQPANKFIRNVVRQSGEAIMVLGTRKKESSKRAGYFKKHIQDRVRERLSPNAKLPNSLIYTPIEDWSNDDVWIYLMQVKNPWGHSNRDLLTMYRGASADNECPLVVDTTTPSCGKSRFGCWVCTMVDQDKSMAAMIQNDEEKAWMEPLLEIRDLLDAQDPKTGIRKEDRHRRDFRRLSGRVQFFKDKHGEARPIHGPYTKEWREKILRMLLETQAELQETAPEDMREGLELIGLDELKAIRRIWLDDKHEFDDSLPRIYEACIGKPYPVEDRGLSRLGPSEWEVLAEVCEDDKFLLELCSHLLMTEQDFHTMSRRVGVHQKLEKVLKMYGFQSKDEALQEAAMRHKVTLALKSDSADEQLKTLRSLQESTAE